MIASRQITNSEFFSFIAVLVFKLLIRKVLFINKKGNKKLLKRRLLFKKIANFSDMVKHKLRVASYQLRVESLKAQVEI